jgi:nucleoid-associated protein YgaU
MGFLDFARDVGRQIFDTDDEAADNIRQHLEIKMSGIRNLEVDFDDGVATIRGECASASDRDLAALIVGNVKGVESVNIDGLTAPAPEQAEATPPEPTYHVVEPGDTLGHIAKRYLGKSSAYMKIFEANRALLDDPNKIYPGQKLLIPSANEDA